MMPEVPDSWGEGMALWTTLLVYGGFPKKGYPSIEPKILSSLLWGPSKGTPNLGKLACILLVGGMAQSAVLVLLTCPAPTPRTSFDGQASWWLPFYGHEVGHLEPTNLTNKPLAMDAKILNLDLKAREDRSPSTHKRS